MIFLQIIFWIVELGLIGGIILYCLYVTGLFISRLYEVPYVPTDHASVQKVFSLLKPKTGSKMLELGCGDGRVICQVVKQYGLIGKGIDLNPFFLVIARLKAKYLGVGSKIEFIRSNAWNADYRWADIIYVFMVPQFVNAPAFVEKIRNEVRPGAYIISNWFEIEDLKSKESHRVQTGSHIAYVYRI